MLGFIVLVALSSGVDLSGNAAPNTSLFNDVYQEHLTQSARTYYAYHLASIPTKSLLNEERSSSSSNEHDLHTLHHNASISSPGPQDRSTELLAEANAVPNLPHEPPRPPIHYTSPILYQGSTGRMSFTNYPTTPVNGVDYLEDHCSIEDYLMQRILKERVAFDGHRLTSDVSPIGTIIRGHLPELSLYHKFALYAIQNNLLDKATLSLLSRVPSILILPAPRVLHALYTLLIQANSDIIGKWTTEFMLSMYQPNSKFHRWLETMMNAVESHMIAPRIVSPEQIGTSDEEWFQLKSRHRGVTHQFSRVAARKSRKAWLDERAITMALLRNGKRFIDRDDINFALQFDEEDYRAAGYYSDQELVIDGIFHVEGIVACDRGYIYFIDSIMFPPLNPKVPAAPDILEYFQDNVSFDYSFNWIDRIMIKGSPLYQVIHHTKRAGQITVFMVSDQHLNLGGYTLDLARADEWFRQHSHIVNPLESITDGSLIDMGTQFIAEGLYTVQDLINMANGHHNYLPVLNGTHFSIALLDDGLLLVDGQSIIQGDIPLYNGVMHLLGGIPVKRMTTMLQKLQATRADLIWAAVQALCEKNPSMVPRLMWYLDSGGTLPRLEGLVGLSPGGGVWVPDGTRPAWLCRGFEGWTHPNSPKYGKSEADRNNERDVDLYDASLTHQELHQFSTGRWKGFFSWFHPQNHALHGSDVLDMLHIVK